MRGVGRDGVNGPWLKRVIGMLVMVIVPGGLLVAAPFQWVPEPPGDPCEGHDIVFSEGSPDPDPARCNASTRGMVAVCWDGVSVINRYKPGAFCTYKDRDCEMKGKRGVSPGDMYRCQ